MLDHLSIVKRVNELCEEWIARTNYSEPVYDELRSEMDHSELVICFIVRAVSEAINVELLTFEGGGG
jgi:hypothetical protein